MAPFNKEDKALFKSLYKQKGYHGRQCMKEFPNKGWTSSINRLLLKLRKSGQSTGFLAAAGNALHD